MKIIVCLKRVPNTNQITVDPVTNTLKRDGVPSIINPDDKVALEAALQLKDRYGATVTALTMGAPEARKSLGEALAMGVDRAVLLTDRVFAGSDTLATSKALTAAIRKIDYDLIITGRQTIDGDTAQVGPQIAAHLNIPQITYAAAIDYDPQEKAFTVKRSFEDGYQLLQAKTPLLITVLGNMLKPRYMRVNRIVEFTDSRDVEIWNAGDVVVDTEQLGLKGSPTKVWTTFTKTYNTDKVLIEEEPRTAARIVAEKLKERHLI